MSKIKSLICLFSWILLSVGISHGSGLGIGIPAFFGTVDYDFYTCNVKNIGISLIFDTNISQNRLYNYRLSLGYEEFSHNYHKIYYYEDSDYVREIFDSHKGFRIITDHSWGFGIFRTPSLRYWLGVNLRTGMVITDGKSGICVGIGITPVGCNYDIGPTISLGMEVGYMLYVDDFFLQAIDWTPDEHRITAGVNKLLFIRMSILFRIHDTYQDF